MILTSRIQHSITSSKDYITLGIRNSSNEVAVIPHTRVLLKVGRAVFGFAVSTPEANRHTEEGFCDDEVAFFASRLNIASLAIPNFDFHPQIRPLYLSGIELGVGVTGYD